MQGVVQASHVAYLSSSDLATADIKEKRENTAKELGTYIHTYIHTYVYIRTTIEREIFFLVIYFKRWLGVAICMRYQEMTFCGRTA